MIPDVVAQLGLPDWDSTFPVDARLPGLCRLFFYNPWGSRPAAFALIEHKEHEHEAKEHDLPLVRQRRA